MFKAASPKGEPRRYSLINFGRRLKPKPKYTHFLLECKDLLLQDTHFLETETVL
jgi:hypothetical protein